MSILDVALAYLRRDWSVIPIDANSKRPLVAWSRYQTKRATTLEVRQWWADHPTAGVGIVTGRISQLVVVDFDGPAATTELGNWPETYEVQTPNGVHRYYLLGPEDRAVTGVSLFGKGVDVRGEGGYVIAPPTERRDGGVYSLMVDQEPLFRPTKLVKAPLAKVEGASPFDRAVLDGPDLVPNGAFEADDVNDLWVARTLAGGAPKGARNDHCARLVGYFAGIGMHQDVTMVQLLQWGSRCSPPMDPDEVANVVDSVYRTVERKAKERAPVARDKAPDVKPMDDTQPPVRFLTLANFIAKYGGHEVEWLIQDWVPAGSILFTVSPPECFKSWLVGEFAVAVASGTPIFGDPRFPANKRGPVLYMQQEDHHGQTAGRLGLQMDSRPTSADDHFLPSLWPDGSDVLFVQEDRDFHFEKKAAVARLEEMIETVRPALVVLDPLYSMVSTDDFMVKAARQMRVLKLWRDRYGCSFVLVHHAGKGTGLTFDRERAWGSQFLNAFVEGGFQIGKIDDRKVGVKRHYKMCQAGPLQQILWVIDTTVDPPIYAPEISDLSKEEVDAAQAEQWQAKTGARPKKDADGELPAMDYRKGKKDE
jgi:hypothetical protein